jgi:NitT/TauT family transport system permease protein
MWIAFACSLFFALFTGYAAAKNKTARALLLPMLDILQSIPVLGFLSASIAALSGLFPHSRIGVEIASIFAIFTGQVWNMCFAFYHSLSSLPAELEDVAATNRLGKWQRFRILEMPTATRSLVWNSMLSFGGGWFFVVQSEAITVMHREIRLPGVGSLMASALERADGKAAIQAVCAMILAILLADQFIWRPLLSWSGKFILHPERQQKASPSWFLKFLQGSHLAFLLPGPAWNKLALLSQRISPRERTLRSSALKPALKKAVLTLTCPARWIGKIALAAITGFALTGFAHAAVELASHLSWTELAHLFKLGGLTLARIATMTLGATLLWTPVALGIGSSIRATRLLEPVIQLAASFPINMTFPLVVGYFVHHNISMNWGSILLLAMGAQWYLLFNLSSGAAAISGELREMCASFQIRGWRLWKLLLLPSLFPSWVTGACTAAGGAWNASVVAEVAVWGATSLKAEGLGAYIAQAAAGGDSVRLTAGILVMSLLVILANKLVWTPLHGLAQRRFTL